MQMVILAGIIVASMPLEISPGAAPLWEVASACAVYLGVTVVLGRFEASVVLRAIRGRATGGSKTSRCHHLAAMLSRTWMIAGIAGLIALGWGHWVNVDLGLSRVPLVGELAAIAPFVLAVLASWTLEYPAHKAMRENLAAQAVPEGSEVLPVWTRRQFLTYNIRHNLLFMLVPIGLIIFLEDALVLYLRPFLPAAFADEIIMAATVVMAGAVFLAAPFLIVRIWRTSPLGPGPLRDELEAMGRELNLRFRDILIWHSDGVIANAGVLGLLGRARYVLLSDLLLKNMSAEHIRAIFAHEAGHVIHRHIPYSVLFFAGAGAISMTSATALADLLRWSDWLAEATGLLLLAPCVVVVFGWISRRFERQSDVTAAWLADRGDAGDADRVTPEGSAIFAGALQRVALLNGISPHQPNWRHGSIAWRVAYMFSLGQTGGSRRGISRLVARVKLALWALVLAAVAVVAWQAIADRLTQTPRQERPVHAPVNVVLPPRDVAHNQPHRERGERR